MGLLRVELQTGNAKGLSMNASEFQHAARELSPGLRIYLERMAGDRAIAEDLLQESLIRISNGLAAFEGKSSLKNWAYTIATRVAIDHFRRSDKHRNNIELDEAQESSEQDVDISESFIIDEMNACIREVIHNLPDDYRAALILHDLEGLTARETADVCGTSLATAKARIRRGRKQLEKALENTCTFYTDDEILRCDRKNPAED